MILKNFHGPGAGGHAWLTHGQVFVDLSREASIAGSKAPE
jgi:hypothetical protein